MRFRNLLALTLALLAVSACVIEPIGGRGRGGGWGGDGERYDNHRIDRPVWR